LLKLRIWTDERRNIWRCVYIWRAKWFRIGNVQYVETAEGLLVSDEHFGQGRENYKMNNFYIVLVFDGIDLPELK